MAWGGEGEVGGGEPKHRVGSGGGGGGGVETGATSVVGHKPSTTQDLNAGKPLEIDPIIGSIIEIANKLKVETPNLKTINSRLKIKAENMGLYKRSKLIDKLTS